MNLVDATAVAIRKLQHYHHPWSHLSKNTKDRWRETAEAHLKLIFDELYTPEEEEQTVEQRLGIPLPDFPR